MNHLKEKLQIMFSFSEVIFAGRANSVLYCLLQAIKENIGVGEIIIPSICCSSVPTTVILAGFKPIFVDVNLDSFTLDLEAVSKSITPLTRAIIAVHIFGHTCEVSTLKENFPDLLIIEDIAQSIGGGGAGNSLHGEKGDFTLMSFGPSKILKGYGGALGFANNEWLPFVQKHLQRLPISPSKSRLKQLQVSYRDLTEGLISIVRENKEINVSKHLTALLDNYREIMLYSYQSDRKNEKYLLNQLEKLQENISERRIKAKYYADNISSSSVFLLPFNSEFSYWRYTFLAKNSEIRRDLTFKLRSENIIVSNHYYPLEKLFTNQFCVNSGMLSDRIINLFTDRGDIDYLEKTCEIINNYSQTSKNTNKIY